MANLNISVQTTREMNNGEFSNRKLTITIGDNAPLNFTVDEARQVYNVLGNILDMENTFEANVERDNME